MSQNNNNKPFVKSYKERRAELEQKVKEQQEETKMSSLFKGYKVIL